ncbi:MAG: hypothetical protein MJB57_06375 [Gemmatimonadetes bacterium]|nr:hypothetical protein [Gemmatimonadota bacterium]
MVYAGLAAGVVFLFGGFGLPEVLVRVFPETAGPFIRGLNFGLQGLVALVATRFATGFVTAWLYAAARFRLRSTRRTAFRVGCAVWLLLYGPMAGFTIALDLMPRTVLGFVLAWGLVETGLAALVGGYVHQATRPADARY